MGRLVKIAIAGEGGQGVQAIGDILAEAGYIEGKETLYIPNFGVEQRGGVSVAFVQISDEQIGSPKFQSGDIVIALSERAIARTRQYVTQETLFVYDSSLIAPPQVDDEAVGIQVYTTVAPEAMADAVSEQPKTGNTRLPAHARQVIGIPATDVARHELTPRVFNMIILGATLHAAGIVEMETVKQALDHKLGKKFEENPALRESNHRALARGIELVEAALKGANEDGKS